MTPCRPLGPATALLIAALALAGCGPSRPDVTMAVNDPHEADNRRIHKFNKALDREVIGPITSGLSGDGSGPAGAAIANFTSNIDLPRVVVNNVLQGDPDAAAQNIVRFVINTTVGLGGIFDPASDLGVAAKPTDFGETLHVWGAREGAFVELPVLGPSTERDAAGRLVDAFLNPLSYVLPRPQRHIVTASSIVAVAAKRSAFGDTVDEVLHGSADSYAQTRLLYLQKRRFELGQTSPADEIDPFALDTEGF